MYIQINIIYIATTISIMGEGTQIQFPALSLNAFASLDDLTIATTDHTASSARFKVERKKRQARKSPVLSFNKPPIIGITKT